MWQPSLFRAKSNPNKGACDEPMKRLLTTIATHTATILAGLSIALIAAQLNQPRVVQDESAVSDASREPAADDTNLPHEFHPTGEIVDIETVVHVRTHDGTIPVKFAFEYPDPDTLDLIQRLQAENRRLKTLQRLQSDMKKIDSENRKFRKEANTQPIPAEINRASG